MRYNFINIVGKKFGKLTVVVRYENSKNGQTRFFCKCDCGGSTIARGYSLRKGTSLSCGCFQKEKNIFTHITHGMSLDPLYKIWHNMIQRCENKNHKNYRHYGGRGISVCQHWHTFEKWYGDMGARPSPRHSMERINNDGNYEPGNVYWATDKDQHNNTRRNHFIEFQDQRKTLAQWAEIKGIPYNTLTSRIYKNWSIEDALTLPVRKLTRRKLLS